MAGLLQSLSEPVTPAAGDTGALAEKMNNIQAYKDATTPAPPAPAAPRSTVAAPKDKINPSARYGSKPGEKRIDTSKMTKPLGSYKKGGKVKKTGVYKLHAKERVLNARQTKQVEGLAKGLSK